MHSADGLRFHPGIFLHMQGFLLAVERYQPDMVLFGLLTNQLFPFHIHKMDVVQHLKGVCVNHMQPVK